MDKSSILKFFQETFDAEADLIVHAPGRVNLIGEHVDYNGGLVLPIAIDRGVTMAGRLRDDRKIRLASRQYRGLYEGSLPVSRSKDLSWANYLLGAFDELSKLYPDLPGFEAVLDSNIPSGSGLSSSAALEVATAGLLTALCDIQIDCLQLAELCQRAENRFVGVSCGLMDQAACACSHKNTALLLDCATPSFERVPLSQDQFQVVIAHSGVHRGLSESAYNERRSECEKALEEINRIGKTDYNNLCQVSVDLFEKVENQLSSTFAKRGRHVITETERVRRAVEYLKTGEVDIVGTLINESHFSLKNDYEVSCPELDNLTECCRAYKGVYGSRLTGAGFGGCTVTLVAPDRAEDLIDYLIEEYYQPKNIKPLVFASEACEGLTVQHVG